MRSEGERRGGVCAREKGRRRSMASVYAESRAERAEKESREGELKPHAFWKMVYGKIFRKPFSSIYKAILRSKTNIFRLTSILRRNKSLQMLKTFYGKRFQSKQTEPKWKRDV